MAKHLLKWLSAGWIFMLMSMALVSAQQGEGENQTPIATALPADVTPTAIPRPTAVTVLTQDSITLELYFEDLAQGGVGVLHITGAEVVGGRARFLDKVTDFFPDTDGDGFYGFIAPGIEQPARAYDLEVYAILADETRITFQTSVSVVLGGFVKETFEIPPDRAYLIDPEVERTEFARLTAIFQNVTNEVLWDSGEVDFQYPVNDDITSPFGAVRVLNGTTETRHTGWDIRAPVGTPVMAMAAGTVAFADTLDIRGNVVIIDHGYGIFSDYAHFSVVNVVRGQSITKGQILGMSGNTGRSSGPHLHWEININGEWVDSVDFLQMWLP
ncbi:MAG: M23 family metallopeptidase [Armatimonadetes bacterium]|nr:M23 family metallopeptidase [Anaerolineae bacterium]